MFSSSTRFFCKLPFIVLSSSFKFKKKGGYLETVYWLHESIFQQVLEYCSIDVFLGSSKVLYSRLIAVATILMRYVVLREVSSASVVFRSSVHFDIIIKLTILNQSLSRFHRYSFSFAMLLLVVIPCLFFESFNNTLSYFLIKILNKIKV